MKRARRRWPSILRTAGALGVATLLAITCQVARHSGDVPLGPAPAGALRLATHNVHYILLNAPSGRWSVGDRERRPGALDLAFKALGLHLFGADAPAGEGRG